MFAKAIIAILPLLAAVRATPVDIEVRQDQVTQIQKIHPKSDDSLCLTSMGGAPLEGAAVQLVKCFEPNHEFYGTQLWSGKPRGPPEQGFLEIMNRYEARLPENRGLCLSRSAPTSEETKNQNPERENGTGLKLVKCIEETNGESQMTEFDHVDERQIWKEDEGLEQVYSPTGPNGQTHLCLDLDEKSQHEDGAPYGFERKLQIWVCSDPAAANQAWTLTNA
ncbi:hypothetical protein I302_106240 [Kwoniella bestiolae CBS 10118]|uniref:Uncharacterized protein n=1 Tax=Kwoniella bestiolae CBS 10118 TaxID=1296100 RepID=A0A1B9G3F0_9TREE|nr:hypothetical protein I302_05364 [Kwoniella bestiolae CBS 10118]OCF25544.1 hypothetical protein I302_05364 [Kwoniella bestiolae CBS 10118]